MIKERHINPKPVRDRATAVSDATSAIYLLNIHDFLNIAHAPSRYLVHIKDFSEEKPMILAPREELRGERRKAPVKGRMASHFLLNAAADFAERCMDRDNFRQILPHVSTNILQPRVVLPSRSKQSHLHLHISRRPELSGFSLHSHNRY